MFLPYVPVLRSHVFVLCYCTTARPRLQPANDHKFSQTFPVFGEKRGAECLHVAVKCLFAEDDYYTALAGGGVVFFRWLLGPLLPFLLALALSAMVEPTVQKLRRKMKVKRSFAAALVTTATLLVVGGTVTALLVRLGMELRQWSGRLPQAVERFPEVWNGLLDRVGAWYVSCPSFLRTALDALAGQLMEGGPDLAGKAGAG